MTSAQSKRDAAQAKREAAIRHAAEMCKTSIWLLPAVPFEDER